MAQTDMLKRYLDAGVAFAQMTQERAEAIVRDLVGAGEVGAEQASSQVQELVERSRENTERLLETVRAEINTQIGNLGLATRDDIDALRREIAELRDAPARPSATPPSAGGSTAPPPVAKKAPAKKAPAKAASGVPDPGAKGAPAKAPAKKKQASPVVVPGTKAPAAKAPAAKKTTKNTAKKAAPRKRS